MQENTKTKIILLVPHNFGFIQMLVKNLEFHGYEVINASYEQGNFRYKNLSQRLENFYRKTALNDKENKKKLKFEYFARHACENIMNMESKADYALVIRSDMFPTDYLKLIASKSNKMISYQWDGLNRWPGVIKHIELYDRFFVFEKNDALMFPDEQLIPLTNCYFDCDEERLSDISSDIFFICTYVKKRHPIVEQFAHEIAKLGLIGDLNVYTGNEKIETRNADNIRYTTETITYAEMLEKVKASKAILDILDRTHNGLSFRIFDAMLYQKKLITDNRLILEYDFYRPNNIFVLSERNMDDLKTFINSPYQKLPQDIFEKYSFKNWVRYVLDQKPYIEISVP
ncbi:MAG: hypothetical protein ACK5IQ_09045 [Bacteroidales bacterium]